MRPIQTIFVLALASTFSIGAATAQIHESGSSDAPGRLTAFAQQQEAEWRYILRTLERYRNDNRSNPNASIFAQQMYNVARISYRERAEVGGWAGDLVRGNLRYAAADIDANYLVWSGPPQGAYRELLGRCAQQGGEEILGRTLLDALFGGDGSTIPGSVVIAEGAAYGCGSVAKGSRHIDVHVKTYVGSYFTTLVEEGLRLPQARRILVTQRALESACREHNAFLSRAVGPGFDQISEIPALVRGVVAGWVQREASEIRVNAILRALQDGVRRGALSPDEYDIITRSTNC